MIPEIISGSYERYKSDTNAFTTWLAETATTCGYTPKLPAQAPLTAESPNPVNGQTLAEKLRAKAEKKAKKKDEKKKPASQSPPLNIVKHFLTTRDLLHQAEAVSRNKKILVPDAIVHVLERAIEARKRCAAWFKKTGLEKDSTEKHLHFIGILEKTLQILRPNYCPRNAKTQRPQEKSTTHDFDGLSNRFSSLEVEDAEDVLEAAAISQTNPKPASKPNTVIDMFELEYDSFFDRMFIVYCFFEDLHRIQSFLHETWTKYEKGSLDLIVASITTTIAFDLVRRQEQNVIRDLFDSDWLDYFGLVDIIFIRNTQDDTEQGHLCINDFIFLSTARSIQKFAPASMHTYPAPVLPFHNSNEEVFNIPEVRRMQKEDEFLSQYLMDLALQSIFEATIRSRRGELPEPDFCANKTAHAHNDDFRRGFEEMRVKNEISTWMVFACRILIDVQEILGDKVTQGWTLLRQTARTSSKKVNMRIVGAPGSEVENGGWAQHHWDSSQTDLLMRIHSEGDLPLLDDEHDMLQELKERLLKEKDFLPSKYYQSYEEVLEDRSERAKRLLLHWPGNIAPGTASESMVQMISPSEKKSFIYTSNPIFCGFKMFEIASDIERAGTVLESYHNNHSIFNISHLYNAALQTGLLKSRWPEMDFVIQTHMNTLFAGKLPENRDDFLLQRFITQFGISAKMFAKNKRTNRVPSIKEICRPGFEHGPVIRNSKANDIFQDYFAKHVPKSIEKCLYELDALVKDENSHTPSTSKSQAKAQRQSQPTTIQILSRVQCSLPALVQQMQIDYVPLHRTCTKLLEEIRERLRTELGIKLDPKHSLEGRLVGLPWGILAAEGELHAVLGQFSKKKFKKALEENPGGGQLRETGPQIQIVSKVLQDFIEKLAGNEGSGEEIPTERSKAGESTERGEKEEKLVKAANATTAELSNSSWESRAAKAFQ